MDSKSWLLLSSGLAASAFLIAGVARAQPQYVLVDLGSLGGAGIGATAVNDAGQVVGIADSAEGNDRGFVWSGGRLVALDAAGGVISQAFGINQDGVVVGIASATLSGPPVPTRWIGGVAQTLGTLGGPGGYAYAINDAGVIVGNAAPSSGPPRAFRHADGAMTDLGGFAGVTSSAFAINSSGWIVGASQSTPSASSRRAFVRRPSGSWLRPAALASTASIAYGINTSSVSVGFVQTPEGIEQAFRFNAVGDGSVDVIGATWGQPSIAYWINDDGWIVGSLGGGSASPRAFLFVDGTLRDLNDGLLGAEGWTVTTARSINNRGWIAGSARDPSGASRAVLLLPRGAGASALTNLSVRAGLKPGRPVIAGVSIGGIGGRLLVARGVGPGLAPLLPPTVHAATDTRITVFDKAGLPETANDDWADGAALREACTAVGAFPLQPGSRDAAVLHPFIEQRTIHLESTDAGVGLVELYDTRRTSNVARLVNLSARYLVGTGDEVLIAGFAIEGPAAKTLLIRGIGPGLAGRVAGHLADGRIVVYDAGGRAVAESDDWPANLTSVFAAVSAFDLPAGSKDAALVVSLAPGAYTVHLSGAPGESGEGLVEIYDLDL